jgi:hypothetical protein
MPGNSLFYKYEKSAKDPKIVNRSSAIFFVKYSKEKKIFTDIHFLNYWKLKNKVANISGKLTIRKLNGSILLSKKIPISKIKSYCIKLNQLLSKKKIQEFTGAAEVELFSKNNLYYPYPAIFARYYGENWHTGTHSTTRYLSKDSGDNIDIINKEQPANESNITLFPEEKTNCYIVLHNGLNSSQNMKVSLTVTNRNCKKIVKKLKVFNMKKGETKILCIDNYLYYKNFLNGSRGMLSVNYKCKGIFPRILFYHQSFNGEISLEHSNFGKSETASKDTFNSKKDQKNLLYSMPILSKNYKTEIDIFPTYPKQATPYILTSTKNNFKGKKLSTKKIKTIKQNSYSQITEKAAVNTTFLEIDYSHEKKLPNRFHTSYYYSKNNSLPAILLDGPIPRHAKPWKTRWAPFFYEQNKLNTKIFLCGRYFEKNKKRDKVNITISLYGTSEKESVKIKKTIKNNENLELNIADIIKKKKWKNNYGWFYIKFEESNFCNVIFTSEYMNKSIISNHAF